MTSANDLLALQHRLREFAKDRDWDQFHSPKNLAMALSVEAAELLEHFQWATDAESANFPDGKKSRISEELADVFLYLIRLSDKLGIDLLRAASDKLAANGAKYPIEKAKGNSKKYTEI
jgi:NTP pyrophosphatase (non-canonical NTP hydrolase)